MRDLILGILVGFMAGVLFVGVIFSNSELQYLENGFVQRNGYVYKVIKLDTLTPPQHSGEVK